MGGSTILRWIGLVFLAVIIHLAPKQTLGHDYIQPEELQIESSKISSLFNQLDIAKADQVTSTFFKITAAGFTGGLFVGGFLNEIEFWQNSWWMPSMVFGTAIGMFSGVIYEKTIFSQLRISQRILNRYQSLLKRRLKLNKTLSSEERAALTRNFQLILQYFEDGYFRTSLSRWKIISIYKLFHELNPADDFETAAGRFFVFDEIYKFALHQVDAPLAWKAHALREEFILQLTSLEWEEHRELTETKKITKRSGEELLANFDTEIGNFSRYLVLQYQDIVPSSMPYLAQLKVSGSGPRDVLVNEKLLSLLSPSKKINLEAFSNLLQRNYPGVWVQTPHFSSVVWQYFPNEVLVPESWKGLEVRLFQHWPPKPWQIQTTMVNKESIHQIKTLQSKEKKTNSLSRRNLKGCQRALRNFSFRQIF